MFPEGDGGSAAVITQPVANDWRPHIPDEVKADPELSRVLQNAQEKDIPSLVKSFAHYERSKGTSIRLPGKDAKPEERTALRQRLYDAGVFEAPPGKPEEYAIAKPEKLPEGVEWSDELVGKLSTVLHKHGAPKALAADLLALHHEVLGGKAATLKTDYDAGMSALKKEHGDKYDERAEAVKRMIPQIFKTPEELAFFEQAGLGDHPGFLSVLLRIAPLAMSDSSFLSEIQRPGGEITGDAAREEVSKIMTDKDHPKHAGYWRQDPQVLAHIEELYRKAYGTQTVAIGGEGVSGDRKL